jgi:NAD(P)H-dependent flavin oxidoreductase YrpB (nitropropane dioxygenase family)
VREIRSLTNGPTGVNVILEPQPLDAIETILEEGIEVLATGFGEPDGAIALARDADTRVFHRCETVGEARRAVAAGAAGVIAQGADSGGRTGIVPTFALVPQVTDVADGLLVVAAGGIADGRGLVAALALGADGILLGTRLVASLESGAHEVYKRGIVEADADDSIVTDIFEIGWPGRHERGAAERDDRGVAA